MVGGGRKVEYQYGMVFVTPIAVNRAAAAVDATPSVVPTAAKLDMTQSRMGANNSVLFYVYAAGAWTLQLQLWVDIAAQGASPKWIKVGSIISLSGGAGEGAFARVDNVPSGLVAPQITVQTGTPEISVQFTG